MPRVARQGRQVEVARDDVAALSPPGGTVSFTGGATEALNWADQGRERRDRDDRDRTCRGARHGRERSRRRRGAGECCRSVLKGWSISPAARPRSGRERPGRGDAGQQRDRRDPADRGAGASSPTPAGALFLRCGAGLWPGAHAGRLRSDRGLGAQDPRAQGVGALWIRDGVSAGAAAARRRAGTGGALGHVLAGAVRGVGAAARLAEAAFRRRPCPCRAAVPRRACARSGRLGAQRRTGRSLSRAILNLRHDGLDVARLMSDLRDIAFSAGSACASGSGRPSHVLRALGLSDAQARASIRIGFGRYTTEDALLHAIDRIVAAARRQSRAA